MTAQDIINNARTNLKIDPNKKIWLDDDLLRWLNEAIGKYEAKTEWYRDIKSASVTIVDGTALYALESDFRVVLDQSVRFTDVDGNVMKVDMVNYEDVVNDYVDLTTEGDYPKYAYLKGSSIGFYPVFNTKAATGSAAYEYYGYTDDYVVGDTVVFPQNYIDILENYIEYKAWGIIPGKSAEMSTAFDKWNIGLRQAMGDILRQKGSSLTFRPIAKKTKVV